MTSRDAVLAQHIWRNDSIWNHNSAAPSFLERQLRHAATMGTTSLITAALTKQLNSDICLGIDCDLDWDDLPADIRQLLLNRCIGRPHVATEDQKTFFKTRSLKMSKGLSFETHIARCNYAAFNSALSLSRINAWINGEKSYKTHKTSEPKFAVSVIDLLGSIKPRYKPSLYDNTVKWCGFCYHSAGTFCKFLSIAFAADPEYQREVRWTYSGGFKYTQGFLTIVFIGIWMWAKAIQQLLLPFFLVSGLFASCQGCCL